MVNYKVNFITFANLTFKNYYKEWNINYNGMPHVSSATMLRLFIPELIDVPKLIYLDIDIIEVKPYRGFM